MAQNDDILDIFSKGGKKPEQKPNASAQTPTFTLMYGTERVTLPFRKGLSVAQAFRENAADLGLDPNRAMVYRCSGETVAATAEIQAYATFGASTTAESKG